MNDLPIERPVREVGPRDKRGMGDVGGGRISQRPPVAVDKLLPAREDTVRDEEPLLPAGSVLVDLEGVNANLGLEEGSRGWAVEERDGVIARTVLVHDRLIEGRDAFG